MKSNCCGAELRQDSIGTTCLKCGQYLKSEELVPEKDGWENIIKGLDKRKYGSACWLCLKNTLDCASDKDFKDDCPWTAYFRSLIKEERRGAVLEYDKKVFANRLVFANRKKALSDLGGESR